MTSVYGIGAPLGAAASPYGPVAGTRAIGASSSIDMSLIQEFNRMLRELNDPNKQDKDSNLPNRRFRLPDKTPEQQAYRQRFTELAAYVAASPERIKAAEQAFGKMFFGVDHKGKDGYIPFYNAVELPRRALSGSDLVDNQLANTRPETDALVGVMEIIMKHTAPDHEKDFLTSMRGFGDKYYAKPFSVADRENMLLNGELANTPAGRALLQAKSGSILGSQAPSTGFGNGTSGSPASSSSYFANGGTGQALPAFQLASALTALMNIAMLSMQPSSPVNTDNMPGSSILLA